jgi:hypothetical protein
MFAGAGLDYANYSQMLVDMSLNDTAYDLDFGLAKFYRIDDDATTNAYNYLASKNVLFTDEGAYPLADLQHMQNSTYTEIIMNNGVTAIRPQDQYTIISDSGGIAKTHGKNEDVSHNVTFTKGVSLVIYDVFDSGDVLTVHDLSDNLLYTTTGKGKTTIDISSYEGLKFRYTTDNTDEFQGFSMVLEIIPTLISNICFKYGTPVNTDQGIIAINDLTINNTIRGNRIRHITETISKHNELVEVKKNSLYQNVPSIDTIMTKEHMIMYNGKMTQVKNLVGNKGIDYIKNTGEPLYNILMDTHNLMVVNNMIVETLHPDNLIAQIYRDTENMNNVDKSLYFKEMNRQFILNHVY